MGRPLPQQVLEIAAASPERLCLIDGNNRHSYGEFRAAVLGLDGALRERVAPGDRVALLMDTSFEYAVATYATWCAGGVAVGLNAALKADALEHLIRHSQARLLLADSRHREFSAVTEKLGEDVAVLPVGDEGGLAGVDDGGEDALPSPDLDGLASIVYTSGTTGHPKGVMLTHRNLAANTESICTYLEIQPGDRALCVLPFYYSYGASILHSHLATGACVLIERSFMYPHAVLERMATERVHSFAGVPSTFYLLLKRTQLQDYDLSSLRYVTQAGGGMDPERIREFREKVPGARFIVMYGQTEATARLAWVPPELLAEKSGSAGRAIPGVELTVMDEKDRVLPTGAVGEVCARGDNVMLGYWRDPEETEAVLRGGWLHTGDVGYMDEDGFLFLQGRAREMIKSGAHRIAPGEIEEVIRGIDGVQDVAVLGFDDEILGQAIRACVIADDDTGDLKRTILATCRNRLPLFKVPRAVEFHSTFPRTASGKIRKHLL